MENINVNKTIEKNIIITEADKASYMKDIDLDYNLSPKIQLILFIICKRGSLEQLKTLHNTYNIDFNFAKGKCLDIAIKIKNKDVIYYLLNNGLNRKDALREGLTTAILYKEEDIVKFLIKTKKVFDFTDSTLLIYAQGKPKIFSYIVKEAIKQDVFYKSMKINTAKEAVAQGYLTINEYYNFFLKGEMEFYKKYKQKEKILK